MSNINNDSLDFSNFHPYDHSYEAFDHSYETFNHCSYEALDHSYESVDHSHEAFDHSHEAFDHSHEAFKSESTGAVPKADSVTYRKTNHLTRTSSLSNIQNLPGPSSTTPNHHPVSPSWLTYFDLLDENTLSPQDIPLIGAPDAPQPGPSTLGLQPPYLSPGDILKEIWDQEASDRDGVYETLPTSTYADTYADEVRDGDIFAGMGQPERSPSPLETDYLGEFAEYIWEQELLQAAHGHPPEPTVGPSGSTPDLPSPEPTTTASGSSGSGATVPDLPRRSQRKRRAVTPVAEDTMTPVVEDTATTATSSSKGKGKEVAREPATSSESTSSTVPRRSKRTREEDVPAIATADSAPPRRPKKPKMVPADVGKAMVLTESLPKECGCGTKFADRTVASIVKHFATHYSDREKAGQAKLQCGWGECDKTLTYGELVRHVKGDHLSARWPCPDCGKHFTRPNGVTRHKQSASACTKNKAVAEGQT